jgi:DNA-binding CsgD family transcriptional regulator
VDVAGAWLEFMADVLASPLTVLPEELVTWKLLETFGAHDCAVHAFNGSKSPMHQVRYYVGTDVGPPKVAATLREEFCNPPDWGRPEHLTVPFRARYKLAIPVLVASPPQVFVMSDPDAFSADQRDVANVLHRLLSGLERELTSRDLGATQTERQPEPRLTPRETVVIALIAEGITAAAAARRLGIAERTVHKHLERIYSKLGAVDRVSAVTRANQMGLL